jgi:phosphate transport system substrate-binding protein
VARRIRLVYTAAAVVPIALLASACGSSGTSNNSSGSASKSAPAAAMVGPALPSKPSTTPKTVLETGSTLLYPLMGAWTQAYQKEFQNASTKSPYATIDTGATGSGTGIADAASGTVDIGASDAYLSSSVKTTTPTLVNIALAISAQQVNYNVPGVKNLKLDGTVLAGMYNGKITNWNDPAIKALNPGANLPSLKIVPLHREDSSGDTFLFTSFLNATAASDWPSSLVNTTITWPKGSTTAETGNGGMVSGCAATKGCVAYIGISYLQKTQAAGLGTAMLKNSAGNFVAPTSATIAAAASAQTGKTPPSETQSMINGPGANSYPIINYEYAIVNTKQSDGIKAEDIRAFLHWTVHAGQDGTTYLDPVDFQPLPASVVKLSDAQIAKIGA